MAIALGLKLRLKNFTAYVAGVPAVITTGLKAWHKFTASTWTGSNRLPDSSPVATNTAALYTGRGLSFDGVNDVVTVGDTGQTIKTVVFYAYPDSTTTAFMQLQSTGAVRIEISSGTLSATGFTTPTLYVNGAASSTVAATTWQQIAVTSATGVSASNVLLGKSNTTFYGGDLSNVKFFTVELTAGQIAELYANPEQDLPTGVSASELKGWWKLNDLSSTISMTGDYSGNSIAGTVSGATPVTSLPGMVPQIDSLRTDDVLRLHGVDYAQISDVAGLDITSAITLEAWVWLNKLGVAQTIIGKNAAYALGISSGNKPQLSIWQTTEKTVVTTSTTLTTNKWYHLAATYDGTNSKIYIDGALDTTSATITGAIDTSADDLLLAALTSSSQLFQGKIDECKIYDTALTGANVTNNYDVQKADFLNLTVFPEWETNNADDEDFVNAFHILASSQTQTTATFGSLSGTFKWAGGVLAPNGKIYGIPSNSTTVLKIDPVAQTTATFGSLSGTGKWAGGVLAPNGKIYGIPSNSTTVLEIDPVNQTTATFGSLSGTAKWFGGVLAPNGKIYGIPSDSTTVLEIDPVNQTTATFGSLSGSTKWVGGVLAPNGKIYCIPRDSTTILEIDPVNQTTATFGSLSGTTKWYGGVLAPNGKIYGIPSNSTTVLEIDPVAQTTATFGSLSGTGKWAGGVLAPNGKIYGIPYNSTTVLEIDPVAQTTATFGSLSGTFKWFGGILAPNGKIYGIPLESTTVLEILDGYTTPEDLTLSRYVNKL